MTEYALVGPQGEIKAYSSAVKPDVGTKPGWQWLPVERSMAAFDAASETLNDEVVAVGDGKVTVTQETRLKTQQELDEEQAAELEDKLPLALATILAELDNRLRAIERKAPRTPEEFRLDAIVAAR